MQTLEKTSNQKKEKLLSTHQVLDRIGVTRGTLFNWEKDGRFPKRVALGNTRSAWRESDIDNWIAALPDKKGDSA